MFQMSCQTKEPIFKINKKYPSDKADKIDIL
jgi:hypothetical protein